MNKEIKIKNFLIIMCILAFLEIGVLVFLKFENTNKYDENYCSQAICNEDNSLCYAYDVDNNGNTIVTWRGSCQNGN